MVESKIAEDTIRQEHIQPLLDSNDELLVFLGNEYLKQKLYPKDSDVIDILTFLSVFSLGYRELKLDDLSNLYKKRIDYYIDFLCRLGYGMRGTMCYMSSTMLDGPLKRIINSVSNRVEYMTRESTRCSTGVKSLLVRVDRDNKRKKK